MMYTNNPRYGLWADSSGNGTTYIVRDYSTGRDIPVEFRSKSDALDFVESIR